MGDERQSLRIDVGVGPDGDAAELDEATTQLRRELLEVDVDDVERPTAPAPAGARAAGADLVGTLVVTFGEEVMRALGRVVGDFLSRGRGRTLTLERNGDSITLSNASDEDQQRALDAFLAWHPISPD
jgi:hypothetical protein